MNTDVPDGGCNQEDWETLWKILLVCALLWAVVATAAFIREKRERQELAVQLRDERREMLRFLESMHQQIQQIGR